jgi:hypothetical protein
MSVIFASWAISSLFGALHASIHFLQAGEIRVFAIDHVCDTLIFVL